METGSTASLLPSQTETTVMHSVTETIKKTTRNFFTLKNLRRRIPIVEWLPKYRPELFLQDLIAGISVGLTAIPQGIAYAGVAGLPLQYGLYSGFMGSFMYLFFGSCKDVTIGPTAILALMTQKYVLGFGEDFAVLLTFLSGCVILLLGIFNLGKSNTFIDVWTNLVKNITTVRLWDSVLGVSTIIILILMRELRKFGSRTSAADVPVCTSITRKLIWLVCLARNAIVIIAGCVLAWGFEKYGLTPFVLTGPIQKGLPPFELPPFSTSNGNSTLDFVEMVDKLNYSIITVALISVLETVAIAKAFSNGKILDSTQEMWALGICNIVGSFFRSMPTTGSFTRTVINNASGVQTTFGGVFTGILVLMALSFLTSSFYFIPKAVLAGLIISAMIFMVEFEVIVLFWKTRKIELLPFFGTVLTCLFLGLELGIVIGIVLNVMMVLASTARPKIDTEFFKSNSRDVLLVTPKDSLLYCSADYFSKSIMKIAFSKENTYNTSLMIIIDGNRIKNLDVTVADSFKIILQTIKSRDQKIFLWRFKPSVRDVLIGVYSDAAKMFVDQKELDEVVEHADMDALAILTSD